MQGFSSRLVLPSPDIFFFLLLLSFSTRVFARSGFHDGLRFLLRRYFLLLRARRQRSRCWLFRRRRSEFLRGRRWFDSWCVLLLNNGRRWWLRLCLSLIFGLLGLEVTERIEEARATNRTSLTNGMLSSSSSESILVLLRFTGDTSVLASVFTTMGVVSY